MGGGEERLRCAEVCQRLGCQCVCACIHGHIYVCTHVHMHTHLCTGMRLWLSWLLLLWIDGMSSVSTVVSGHPALVPSPISNGIAKVAGDVQAFHVYHLSKTGGSTLMHLFDTHKENGLHSLLTKKGQDMFTGQTENRCNEKMCGCWSKHYKKCSIQPNATFILGTM